MSLVIACNTASAVAYDSLKQRLNNRAIVLNVIDPVVQEVCNASATLELLEHLVQ